MVEACWRAVQPILDDWSQRTPADFPNYASGSAGPASADTLLAMGGRSWRPLNTAAELNTRRTARPKADAPSAEKSPQPRATKKRAPAKKAPRAGSPGKTAARKSAPAKRTPSTAKRPRKK